MILESIEVRTTIATLVNEGVSNVSYHARFTFAGF